MPFTADSHAPQDGIDHAKYTAKTNELRGGVLTPIIEVHLAADEANKSDPLVSAGRRIRDAAPVGRYRRTKVRLAVPTGVELPQRLRVARQEGRRSGVLS
jgi:hypothetical protein